MFKILDGLFGSNKKQLVQFEPLMAEINRLEPEIKELSDEELRAKTDEFRERLNGQTPNRPAVDNLSGLHSQTRRVEGLDTLLPEAFAVCREAIRRTVGERAYDVQLMAAIALHQGKAAEQKTGEGKTLGAVIALYLNALGGKGCHLVTVNDYLARRDTGWYGQALDFLGLQVGCIAHDSSFILDPSYTDESQHDPRLSHLRPVERKEAYRSDVTYGTNNEFGFDYLRDNMARSLEQMVQTNPAGEAGAHHFAIVDEVDFILIDEARTPLIISAPREEAAEKYYDFARLAKTLVAKTDFEVDEKAKTVGLTDLGLRKVEKKLGIDNIYETDFGAVRHLEQALKAQTLFHRDVDYIVKDGEVVIVDEFTGRLMPGRRYSEGLHQALEAKEGVAIERESQTLATISLQNYFRMYEKLAGMSGTIMTEAEEFAKIYGLESIAVPTNEPVARIDHPDAVYKTESAKWRAVVREIEDCHERGQPVLVGTTSVEKNQLLHSLLRRKKILHEVLNAKNHEREAEVIAQAGRVGAVTVATNMAGRGVDIKLGGERPEAPNSKSQVPNELEEWKKEHEKVLKFGGLHVIGTERHEARRIDNQLRGRSGRQGDPGSSRFFVSLEDDLMRIFGGDQVRALMDRFGMDENVPLEHAMVSKSIGAAQKKVEGFNFDIRKHLVEYDDVANVQREIVYGLRQKILEGRPIDSFSRPTSGNLSPPCHSESAEGETKNLIFGGDRKGDLSALSQDDGGVTENVNFLLKKLVFYNPEIEQVWAEREKELGQVWFQIVRDISLGVIDLLWMEHIDTLTDLREGIGLRAHAQQTPLVEYKRESHTLFERLMREIYSGIAERLVRLEVRSPEEVVSPRVPRRFVMRHDSPELGVADEARQLSEVRGQRSEVRHLKSEVRGPKVGRNDPCPCGSGKKYKHCCGRGF